MFPFLRLAKYIYMFKSYFENGIRLGLWWTLPSGLLPSWYEEETVEKLTWYQNLLQSHVLLCLPTWLWSVHLSLTAWVPFQTSCWLWRGGPGVCLVRRSLQVYRCCGHPEAVHALRIPGQSPELQGLGGESVDLSTDTGGPTPRPAGALGSGHRCSLSAAELDGARLSQWHHLPVPRGLRGEARGPDI